MGPTIETARLILRPPREEDLDGWAALMGDEESARYIGGTMPRARAWRSLAAVAGSWALRGYGMFSVLEKDGGRWVGHVGPWYPEGWPGPEIGWALLKDVWGRGYARESAEAALNWAFGTLGWTEVVHIIDPRNERSQALAARLGAHNSGPTRLPPPFDETEVDLWRQSREQWEQRSRI